MNKVLILGIGGAQVDAIKYCKIKGLEVHACADDENGLGKMLVDKFSLIDIKNAEEIFNYAVQNEIELVYSVGVDIAIPVASDVSEKLHLPYFVSSSIAKLIRSKDKLRALLGKEFWGNVDYLTVNSLEESYRWDTFPCIIKPSDSQGQRGFYVINDRDELERNFDKSILQSPSNTVILEEYIEGPEISANVYVVDGKIAFMQTTDRIVFDENPGIVKAHKIPSRVTDEEIEMRVFDLVQYVSDKLQIKNGPLYFQMKINSETPKLIEVTPRLDGCHLWQLIYKYCGVDLLKITFEHLFGNKIDVYKNKPEHYYTLRFITDKPHTIVDRKIYGNQISPQIQWYYEDGDVVREINNYQERIGHYIEKD